MKVSNTKDRLQQMMSDLNLKPADISRTTGVPKSALSHYINGNREPRQDKLSLLADPYNINPAWLMGYDVPMYNKTFNKEAASIDVMIISKYSQLNDTNKKIVMDMIDSMIAHQE